MFSQGGIQVRGLGAEGFNSESTEMDPLILPYQPIIQSLVLNSDSRSYIIKGIGQVGSTISAYSIETQADNYGIFTLEIPVSNMPVITSQLTISMINDNLTSDQIVDIPLIDQPLQPYTITVTDGWEILIPKHDLDQEVVAVHEGDIYTFTTNEMMPYWSLRLDGSLNAYGWKLQIFYDNLDSGYLLIPPQITVTLPTSIAYDDIGYYLSIQVNVGDAFASRIAMASVLAPGDINGKQYGGIDNYEMNHPNDIIVIEIPKEDLAIGDYRIDIYVNENNVLTYLYNNTISIT